MERIGMKSIDESWKDKFYAQRAHAKERGVDWELTRDEWKAWWGDDLHLRGRGCGKLQMCRFEDKGPYSLSNIYKGTHNDNSSLKFKLGFKLKKKAITNPTVNLIRARLRCGESTRAIAKEFNTSQKTVMRIKHRKEAYV